MTNRVVIDRHTLVAGPALLRTREVRGLVQVPDSRTKKGKRDAAILAVLVGAGLRVGEAVKLTAGNVERGGAGRLRLTFKTSKTRSERLRTVSMPVWAAKPLVAWLGYAAPRYWLFPGQKGEHLSVRAAEKLVNKYLLRIGRSDLHTHSLRHTFGSMVTRETRSLFVAQKLLGHADPAQPAKVEWHLPKFGWHFALDVVDSRRI